MACGKSASPRAIAKDLFHHWFAHDVRLIQVAIPYQRWRLDASLKPGGPGIYLARVVGPKMVAFVSANAQDSRAPSRLCRDQRDAVGSNNKPPDDSKAPLAKAARFSARLITRPNVSGQEIGQCEFFGKFGDPR